ncbi:Peptidase M20, dimerization domain containing protein [Trema orientale]|uniref:Peptidase M20, dimerization domain containing protein n=1 Tax=Trema orientale TaxID=63057 RepID=A0A2P5DQU4_TREOI|nr:Peptidase M20, dimerization domain containing protein [Trema orientale]
MASRSGHVLARCGFFRAVISGKRGHAALPQESFDPILAASNVVIVANFQGGDAFNVTPDSVTTGDTFHAFSKESLTQLRQRIEQVIMGQAAKQRCKASRRYLDSGYYLLGMENKTLGKSQLVHSPYFQINEVAIPCGAALHASLWLQVVCPEFQPKVYLPEGELHDAL